MLVPRCDWFLCNARVIFPQFSGNKVKTNNVCNRPYRRQYGKRTRGLWKSSHLKANIVRSFLARGMLVNRVAKKQQEKKNPAQMQMARLIAPIMTFVCLIYFPAIGDNGDSRQLIPSLGGLHATHFQYNQSRNQRVSGPVP